MIYLLTFAVIHPGAIRYLGQVQPYQVNLRSIEFILCNDLLNATGVRFGKNMCGFQSKASTGVAVESYRLVYWNANRPAIFFHSEVSADEPHCAWLQDRSICSIGWTVGRRSCLRG